MHEPNIATSVVGRIFDIQRCSLHDGPGIRTTVFMKGCPLRCAWCHNPEGQTSRPLLSFVPEKCIGCGYCLRVCRNQGHRVLDGRHALDRAKCVVCGLCTRECFAGALEVVGRDVTVEDVLEVVLRDRPFYESSMGGITLSGGEPLLQAAFSKALLQQAKQAGLHCCVETCGQYEYDRLEAVAPYVDLFLYDWKESDPARHLDYCGASNERILANLRALHDAGRKIRLRCPIIPGFNDRSGHFQGIAALAQSLPNLEGVELLPYHRLGESKIRRFGLDHEAMLRVKAVDPDSLPRWTEFLRRRGLVVVNSVNPHVEPAHRTLRG